MRRRRRSPINVSLSAFQDVIMSVSGIVIVIMLLLTLELVQAPRPGSATASAALLDQLREAVKQGRADQAELQAALLDDEQIIQAAASISPGDLRDGIARNEDERMRLEEETERLTVQLRALERTLQEAEVSLFELKEVRDELAELRIEAQRLRGRIDRERQDDRTVYSLPRGVDKQGWLVVVSAGEVAIAPLGRPAAPTTFSGGPVGLLRTRSAAAQFLKWTAGTSPQQSYFLILIRPDGSEAFDHIQEDFDQRTLSYGFDLVGADEVVLHPHRGASE